MTAESFIDDVLAEYLAAELPPDPVARVAALHDIVWQRWGAIPLQDRLALSADADGDGTLDLDESDLAPDDVSELEEPMVNSLIQLVRARIPELSVPEL